MGLGDKRLTLGRTTSPGPQRPRQNGPRQNGARPVGPRQNGARPVGAGPEGAGPVGAGPGSARPTSAGPVSAARVLALLLTLLAGLVPAEGTAEGTAAGAGAGGRCTPDVLGLRGNWGQARFRVEVVDDARGRARGLMGRKHLPRLSGMLFVYDHPQRVAFWMKNTLIPLDMLFADATGRVVSVHENAVPGDLTPIPGGEGVQFVLEINGGMAALLGIAPGSEMRHPAIASESAAWPCDE